MVVSLSSIPNTEGKKGEREREKEGSQADEQREKTEAHFKACGQGEMQNVSAEPLNSAQAKEGGAKVMQAPPKRAPHQVGVGLPSWVQIAPSRRIALRGVTLQRKAQALTSPELEARSPLGGTAE